MTVIETVIVTVITTVNTPLRRRTDVSLWITFVTVATSGPNSLVDFFYMSFLAVL